MIFNTSQTHENLQHQQMDFKQKLEKMKMESDSYLLKIEKVHNQCIKDCKTIETLIDHFHHFQQMNLPEPEKIEYDKNNNICLTWTNKMNDLNEIVDVISEYKKQLILFSSEINEKEKLIDPEVKVYFCPLEKIIKINLNNLFCLEFNHDGHDVIKNKILSEIKQIEQQIEQQIEN